MAVRVGVDNIKDKKSGKDRKVRYSDVEYDKDGWADSSKYLPEPLHLLFMKTATSKYNGWWTGTNWDGARITTGKKILHWKRQE